CGAAGVGHYGLVGAADYQRVALGVADGDLLIAHAGDEAPGRGGLCTGMRGEHRNGGGESAERGRSWEKDPGVCTWHPGSVQFGPSRATSRCDAGVGPASLGKDYRLDML